MDHFAVNFPYLVALEPDVTESSLSPFTMLHPDRFTCPAFLQPGVPCALPSLFIVRGGYYRSVTLKSWFDHTDLPSCKSDETAGS